ncbi:peptidoglycan-binding domain-containing protein [Ornithinimicrobium cryptoxanthini]|uniref:Peptidoglycan-binding protein n=1 Tax=Ornithinimicrobium cryptoxanthini TaxID=2934161 RepID=A0ABY4YI35_9MICO|nr:peptidoglycan-binding protein [Ornithinimicrobium cryptoxanthini]USQ76426.1 peptidoglycan-binding protein [Ornithinimicrobium cryptoxanthini]
MQDIGGTTRPTGGRRAAGRGRHRELHITLQRRSIAVLGAALVISMVQFPASGDGKDGGDSGASSTEGSGQGSTPALPGTSSSGGLQYGGRSMGPSPLLTLPEDPSYPVPEAPVNESLPDGVELPEDVDQAAVFQRNVICDPVAKPGVIAVANLLGQAYDRPGYTLARSCIDLRSEHYDGRAVDWQLNAYDPMDRRIGDAAATWLTDNDGEVARRLGIQSVIWNNRSWHASDGTWRAYAGQSPHTDHIHISLTWDGANMRTSWWTGVALTAEEVDQGPCAVVGGAYAAVPQAARTEPCDLTQFWPADTGYASIRPGGQGAGLGLVQPLLDVPQTNQFDLQTREALLVWQDEQGIPQTGVLDQLTYAAALGWELPELPEAALAVAQPDHAVTEFTAHKRAVLTEGDTGEVVKVLQGALGVDDDGVFGPLTAEALTEFAGEHPLLLDDLTATDTLVWELLEQRAHPHLALRQVELEIGDEGYPVQVLQRLLELEDDGIFGPMTQQGVLDAQGAAELEETGLVDGATWQAIDEAAVARANADAEAEKQAEADAKAKAQAEADAKAKAQAKGEAAAKVATDAKAELDRFAREVADNGAVK